MQHADGRLSLADRHDRPLVSYHIPQGTSNDCGPHVVAMLVNFWQGQDLLDADAVARAMNRPTLRSGWPPLVVRRIPNWATFPWGISDMLTSHGVPARWRLHASEDDLQQALGEDRPVLPIFGEPLRRRGWRWTGWSHVAILAGWDPAVSTYWFVDSAREFAPSSRMRSDFLRYWSNLGNLLVEVE